MSFRYTRDQIDTAKGRVIHDFWTTTEDQRWRRRAANACLRSGTPSERGHRFERNRIWRLFRMCRSADLQRDSYILEVVRGPFDTLKKKVMELKRRYNP